jgi:mono/diheme cytochrome c family protein
MMESQGNTGNVLNPGGAPGATNPVSGEAKQLSTDRETRHTPEVLPMHQQAMREMREPRDGVAPTPVWLMMVYFGLLMWGGYYLANNAGGFRVDVYNENPAAMYRGEGKAAAKKPADPMVIGKRTYNNCMQCHQPNGAGVAGAFPPLDGSERVTGPDHVLAAILLHGIQGEVVVRGQRYRGEMPAWNQLSDEEIAGVLTYIRASWSNRQPPVSPELVAAMRKQTSGKAGAWRDEELDALAKQGPPKLDAPAATGAAAGEGESAGGK